MTVKEKKLNTERLADSAMREVLREMDSLIDHYILRNGNIAQKAFLSTGIEIINLLRNAIGVSGLWTHLNDLPVVQEPHSINQIMFVYKPTVGEIKAVIGLGLEENKNIEKATIKVVLQLIIGTFYNSVASSIRDAGKGDDLENAFFIEELMDNDLICEILIEVDNLIYDGDGLFTEFRELSGRRGDLPRFRSFGTRRR